MNVKLSKETVQALDAAKQRHPWLEEKGYDDLTFALTLEWIHLDDEETLNDWLKEFF